MYNVSLEIIKYWYFWYRKTAAVRPLTTHLTSNCLKSKDELIYNVLLTPTHRSSIVGRPAKTYISSVRTLDVVGRTCQERWMDGERGRERERESGKSVSSARFDDNDLIYSAFLATSQLPSFSSLSPLFLHLSSHFYLFFFLLSFRFCLSFHPPLTPSIYTHDRDRYIFVSLFLFQCLAFFFFFFLYCHKAMWDVKERETERDYAFSLPE